MPEEMINCFINMSGGFQAIFSAIYYEVSDSSMPRFAQGIDEVCR